jgi:hypothetical protein
MNPAEPNLWDPDATMAQHGEAHLRALAAALGHDELAGLLRVYKEMTRHWGQVPLSARAFPSDLTFDASPLEFSVATSGAGARLRWAVDCVAADGNPAESRALGLDLCERLGAFGADRSRLRVACELLAAAPRRAPLMVGVDLGARGTMFKAYLRGQGAVAEGERACVEALEALGLRAPAQLMREAFEGEGAAFHLFALDLEPSALARVKVYVSCGRANFGGLLAKLVAASGEGEGKLALVRDFVRVLSGRRPGVDVSVEASHLVFTVQFVAGRDAPLGLACNYAHQPVEGLGEGAEALDDGRVSQRVGEAFALAGLSEGPYRRALEAFARVPLGNEYLLHNCVTLQGTPGAAAISVYLNPRFNAYQREPDEW